VGRDMETEEKIAIELAGLCEQCGENIRTANGNCRVCKLEEYVKNLERQLSELRMYSLNRERDERIVAAQRQGPQQPQPFVVLPGAPYGKPFWQ